MATEISQFFKGATLRICGTLDINQAAAALLPYLNRYLPADMISLTCTDIPRKEIHNISTVRRDGVGIFENTKFADTYSVDQGFIDLLQQDIHERTAVTMVNRAEEMPPYVIRLEPGVVSNSYIALLLSLSDQFIGHMTINAKGRDRYSQKHIQLLESIKEPVAIALSNWLRYRELLNIKENLAEDNRTLSSELKKSVSSDVVGADYGLKIVMEMVQKVAHTNSPILLLGETGTGKDVIANAIHAMSQRSREPMVSMQCGAIPETLLASELFGHEKGAFTGAASQKRGRFERADKGTLFIDEIGELSASAQVKLLRVLQEQTFERVGGTRTIKTNARLIAATHRDLEKMVREGRFREDLWYRLNVIPIEIPPLRSRKEDIPALIHYFIRRKARELNLEHIPEMNDSDLDRLKSYDWPGNVRELENIVERALILSQGGRLFFPDLDSGSVSPHHITQATEGILPMDQAMALHIRRALKISNGKISGPGGAAHRLEMNESTLRFRMKKLGIRKFDSDI